MLPSNTSTVVETAVSQLNETSSSDTDSEEKGFEKQRIIASLTVVFSILVISAVAVILYRKLCRSSSEKHGVEMVEDEGDSGNGKHKTEYYDQFGVESHELTVNSMTAVRHDYDEDLLRTIKNQYNSTIASARQQNTTTSPSITENSTHKVTSSKRVFQIEKVGEVGDGSSATPASHHREGTKLHPTLSTNSHHTLHTSDGHQYILALVDKESKAFRTMERRSFRVKSSNQGLGAVDTNKISLSRSISHY